MSNKDSRGSVAKNQLKSMPIMVEAVEVEKAVASLQYLWSYHMFTTTCVTNFPKQRQ